MLQVVTYDQADQAFALIPAATAMQGNNVFCSEYISPGKGSPAIVWRYIQVGIRRFWLEIQHPTDWRATAPGCIARLLYEDDPRYHRLINEPLFAIDFIPERHLYAIGWCAAPLLRGTIIEKLLSPTDIARLIHGALIRNNPK